MVAPGFEQRLEMAGRVVVAAVLEHAGQELVGRLLGRRRLAGVLVGRQEEARLQLEEGRDQDEELRGRLEVELAGFLEVLDIGDDDLTELHLGQVHALTKDDGHEEVEWAREDVELQVQVGNGHGKQRRRAAGRGARRPAGTVSIVPCVAERARGGDGESSRPHALDIYARVIDDTEEELTRPESSLVFSGLFAGFAIGLAPLVVALTTAALGSEVKSTAFIASLLYPIGYVAVIVGRSQFFTENTLYPVMLTLRRREYLSRTLRLWAIVFPTNLIGAFIFACLAVLTGTLSDPVQSELVSNGVKYTGGDATSTFWSAVTAGFLLALVAWLVEAVDTVTARIAVIWSIAFIVSLATLDHCIATTVNAFGAFLDGELGGGELLGWLGITTLGNVLGGVVIVASINYGQVREED